MSADTRTELIYAIESADGSRLFYEAENLDAILLAAAAMRDDFPGEEFIVKHGGTYDPAATLLALEGMAV